ncbi:MAG: hypothetical protein U9R19_04170 [Bacteroidota bacterium]|nr:hypothetical protein [Bacteroidota bacterium]
MLIAQNQLGISNNQITNSIDSTGNVGIGTSNPTHTLEVVGTSKFTGTIEVDSAAVFNDSIVVKSTRVEDDLIVEGDLIMRKYSNDTMVAPRAALIGVDGTLLTLEAAQELFGGSCPWPYWESGEDKIFVSCYETDYKVGINTANPTEALDLRGKLKIQLPGINNEKIFKAISNNSPNDNEMFLVPQLGEFGYNKVSLDNDFGLFWSDHNNGDWNGDAGLVIAPWASDPDRKGIRISGDGKVGIGTNNPLNKLDVEGDQYISGKLGIGITSPGLELEVEGDQYLSGKLGIGVTNPDLELEVDGDQYLSGKLVIGDNTLIITNESPFTVHVSNNETNYRMLRLAQSQDMPVTDVFDEIFFTTRLTAGWASHLSKENDMGMFFTDRVNATFHNINSGLVIAPWNGHDGGIRIDTDGNVGIGISEPQSMLAVNGKITAKEIEVTLTGFSDFVFYDDYKLMPLKEVEQFIDTHKHLPDVPSEQEVIENGLNLGEMDAVLLQKVEELTLYTIEQQKQIELLTEEIQKLKKQ